MRAQFDASGDVIVITGGANGIGRALALACAKIGAKIVVCDVDETAAATLVAENSAIEFVRLDVSDRAAVFAAFAGIEQRHGKIDGMVCGAAIQPRVDIHATEEALWRRVLDINLNGVVWCYQAAIGGMIRRRRGSIIAFSSGLAATGWPKASAYSATKGALVAFIRSAGKEVSEHRVRVNLVAPGVIDTPQYRAANAGADHGHWQGTTGVGTPEDAIGPLLFMLSDAASMTASIVSRDYAYAAQE